MTVENGEPEEVDPERADELAVLDLHDLHDLGEVASDDKELAEASANLAETVNRVLSPSWASSTQRMQKMLGNVVRPKVLRDIGPTRKWMEDVVQPVRPERLDPAESLSTFATGRDQSSFVRPRSQTMKVFGELGSPTSSVLKNFAASEEIRRSMLGTTSAFGDIHCRACVVLGDFGVEGLGFGHINGQQTDV